MAIVERVKEAAMVRSVFGSLTTTDAPQRDVSAEELRRARLEAARRTSIWTEIEEVDLVPRGRGWLVSAETDEIFVRHRGVVFASGSVSAIADRAELYFYVDRAGEVVFLEKVTNPASWTEHLERQAAKERRRAAPRPRRGRPAA